MDSNVTSPRHWFRFSLRTLLLWVTLCGAIFGWLGALVRHSNEQTRIVNSIERLRCVVSFHSKTPRWMIEILGVDPFEKVISVYTYGENFSDATFADIQGFVHVRLLTLINARITDEGLQYIEAFKQLRYLSLENTPVSDAGLAHLAGLTRLERLELDHTHVTDAGLVHLQGLKRLEEINLDGTQVTDEGCRRLQAALPQLHIIR